MKVLIDKISYFSLSQKALRRLIELGVPLILDRGEGQNSCIVKEGGKLYGCFKDMARSDLPLLQVFEEMGQEMSNPTFFSRNDARSTQLAIVEVPDDVQFTVQNADICKHEIIIENHRTWE